MTAVYNVAPYLPDFIRSIDEQGFRAEGLEVIAVDDGSTDDSLELLRAWAERAPYRVEVLTKSNGGQGSARNLGLTVAQGEWVTFTDPDDMLGHGYLDVVDRYLASHPDVQMAATNRIFFDDETGLERDGHPLRKMFVTTRSADIDGFPDRFQGSAPAAFLRLDLIRSEGLTFDTRIRPNFEDGHFCSMYMLRATPRVIAFLPEARYLYRKRGDLSSTLQQSLKQPGRFTDVIEFGYIDILEAARSQLGYVPEWLQNLIIYELSWYFSSQDAPFGAQNALVGEVADRFHALMRRLLPYLDPQVIRGHRVRSYKPIWRDVLLHAWADEPWCSSYAVADPVDLDTGLVRIVYRYIGTPPVEEFTVRGRQVPPRHAKVRPIEYFDRTLMYERIAWVNCRGTLRLRLDGRPVPIQDEWVGALPLSRFFSRDEPEPTESLPQRVAKEFAGRTGRDPIEAARVATRRARTEFAGAWVLVDRVHDADDSAEVLFRYLRRSRPDINAWFAIEEGTPDWERLQRDGYGRRMVAWGSLRWKALMANCSYLISSHVDAPIHRPPAILEFTEPRWKFVFLQHGIIKDDLSNWLNPKDLSLFVTSTAAEYASIAGDGTRYVYTTKEVQNTGLPRFDQLLEAGRRYPPEKRDLVVVAPTWRYWLVPPTAEGSQRRVVRDGFWQTEYAENWMGLIRSGRLRDAVLAQGLRIGFLPHPNLQSILESQDLPDHVVPLRFTGQDVRSHFARAAALTTDYSSMAFNAAYLERPVTYFQFDAEAMFGGGHVGRGGYFDYERDGLGPVSHDLESAIDDLIEVLEHGRDPHPFYLERIRSTFQQRDGRACERVTAAIEALGRPLSAVERITAVPTPSMSRE